MGPLTIQGNSKKHVAMVVAKNIITDAPGNSDIHERHISLSNIFKQGERYFRSKSLSRYCHAFDNTAITMNKICNHFIPASQCTCRVKGIVFSYQLSRSILSINFCIWEGNSAENLIRAPVLGWVNSRPVEARSKNGTLYFSHFLEYMGSPTIGIPR